MTIRNAAATAAFLCTLALVPACSSLDNGSDDGTTRQPETTQRVEIRSRTDKGPVLYVLRDATLRTPGDAAAGTWFRDGANIRRGGPDGKVAYHFARGELRQSGATGTVLLTIRGRKVFRGVSDQVLFVVRNGTVHRGDADGTRVLWLHPDCPDWALAMALHGMY